MKQARLLSLFIFSLIVVFSFANLSIASATSGTNGELAKIEDSRKDNVNCLRCHGAKGLKTTYNGETISLYINEADFLDSMHESNTCITCHKGMTDYPHVGVTYGYDLRKKVNQECQSCHQDITKVYNNSIHGQLLAEGKQTALCSDCHGAHNVFKKEDKRSQVYLSNMVNACTKCHEEKKESYSWGIHGKAVALGSTKKAATCSVCHTSHSIWGPDDARSTVSDRNIPKTCSQCHTDANENFAKGIEHYTLTPEGENAPMYYTYKAFSIILVLVVAIFVLNIELDLYRRIKNAKK